MKDRSLFLAALVFFTGLQKLNRQNNADAASKPDSIFITDDNSYKLNYKS